MRFEKLLIAFVIFAIFATGGALIITDQAIKYDIPLSFNYTNITGSEVTSKTLVNQTLDAEDTLFGIETSETTTEQDLFRGGFSTLSLLTRTVNLFQNIASTISTALNIPPFIVTAFNTMLIIVILFTSLYMVFRFQPR